MGLSKAPMRKLVLAGLIVGAALASEPAAAEKNVAGWTFTGAMTTPRYGHTATLLQNGEVLIAGGAADTSAELYDPKTRMWRTTGSMNTIGKYISTTLIPTGQVLAVGASYAGVIGAELYDPETGTWTTTTAPNFGGSPAFLARAGGKVLAIAQGSPWDYGELSAQLFDMATEEWRAVADLKMSWVESVTLLRDDNVLVTGLYGANFPTQAELFNPF